MKLKHLLHATVALWVSLALPHSPASAGVPPAELIQYGMPPSLAQFAANISASEGDWTSVNWAGCVGAFQFCSGTLEQYYHGTREQFLNDPRAQVQAHLSYLADEWALVQRHGYSELIGQQVCYNGRCATITASSLLKACQFGCGPDGKLANFLNLSDCDHPKVRDGNNYSVCNYLISGAGYDVSHIIGEQENGIEGIGSIAAGMCLQLPIMSQAGEKATSPFGVDRTGRASVGYHLGLDLINSVGRGDSIYAGVPGRVIVARNSGMNDVFVETSDGKMRFGYLHGDSINVRVGDEVQNNTQVITMGSAGSGEAVHLHLYTALSGDLVRSLGEAAGVVWPLADGDFRGDKRSGGLSGAGLAESAPSPFYMVNPETYLHHRVPFAQDVLNSEQYRRQGFSRPDGMTLEPTCAPPPEFFAGGSLRSTNGGSTVNGGMAATGQAAGSNPQTLVNMAASDGRDAIIQRGLSSIGETTRTRNYGQSRRSAASVWAGLIFAWE